jgi:hypothetical protein
MKTLVSMEVGFLEAEGAKFYGDLRLGRGAASCRLAQGSRRWQRHTRFDARCVGRNRRNALGDRALKATGRAMAATG